MKPKWYLFLAGAVLACVLAATWSLTPVQGEQKTYEVQPQINLPEYGTDTVIAIDAYERLMDRYMGMTERVFAKIDTDVHDVSKKLDSINHELTRLTDRIEGIENALKMRRSGLSSDGSPLHTSPKGNKESLQSDKD